MVRKTKPEDHWTCNAHLSAEDMLKSVVIEEKKYYRALGQGQTTHWGQNFVVNGKPHHLSQV